jgi:8-amino-7-oxononanoate synthase
MKTKHRNTRFVHQEAAPQYQAAIEADLMQVTITARDGKYVTLPGGRQVVEFINCSYLGLDQHPKVVEAYRSVDPQWGVNFCCARSRFSIAPLRDLEERLSAQYGGRAVTFPSVTTTHVSAMPLVASGVLIDTENPPPVCFLFDRFAHSSMQTLKPILAEEATVQKVRHNDLDHLRLLVLDAKGRGKTPVYVADGIYSMGGTCPIDQVLAMAEELDFYLYIDDAHGTTIFGERGEGPVLARIGGVVPDRLFLTFCLSKGFGGQGGGILVSDRVREGLIRSYGQIYAFSAALDFAPVQACHAVLDLHSDGTVRQLQQQLRDRVALFDRLRGDNLPFSPIRMVQIGDEKQAIRCGRRLIEEGFFVSVVFFPIVPRGNAQLRICLAATHSASQIEALSTAIDRVKKEVSGEVSDG